MARNPISSAISMILQSSDLWRGLWCFSACGSKPSNEVRSLGVSGSRTQLTQVGHLVLRTYCYKTGIRKNQISVAPRRGRPRRRGGVAAATGGGGGASAGGGWPAGTCRTSGGSATPTALNTAPEQPGACARSTNRFEPCSTVSSSTRSRSRTISPHSALTPAAVSRSSSSLRTNSARNEQNRCPAIAASE